MQRATIYLMNSQIKKCCYQLIVVGTIRQLNLGIPISQSFFNLHVLIGVRSRDILFRQLTYILATFSE